MRGLELQAPSHPIGLSPARDPDSRFGMAELIVVRTRTRHRQIPRHSQGDSRMRPLFAVGLLAGSLTLAPAVHAAAMEAPSQEVQKELIALDKKGGVTLDKAVLEKVIADNALVVGPMGEGGGKKEQIAAMTATPSAGYVADEYKFEMLTPNIVLMTHRGSSTSKEKGKDVKESTVACTSFRRRAAAGRWSAAPRHRSLNRRLLR